MTAAPATILVVDDNPITLKLVRVTLESAGHQVLEARDARTAFEIAEKKSPEIVILDLVLPDLHGFELFFRLRTLLPGVPILGFTGLVSKQDEARALSLGFDDFLIKPLEPSRLLQAVEAHLPAVRLAEAGTGAGRALLVVDDDPIQLKLAGLRFREAGFEVVTAGGGEEALTRARKAPPHVIVSDVLMPGMDGLRLCHAIRRDPALRHIPVVLVSSKYVEDEDHELGVRVGASAFVLRTPDLKEALGAVNASLETPAPAVGEWDETIESEYVGRVARQLDRQVAINAGLLERATLKASSLSVIGAVSEALAGMRSEETALEEALDKCLDGAGLSKGALFLVERGRLQMRAKVGLPSGAASELWGSDLLRTVMESGSPWAIARGEGEDAVARSLLIGLEAGSALLLPLAARGERQGLLLLASARNDLSLGEWLPFAQAVAAQFAQALALTGAFAALAAAEEHARTRAAQQAAVARLGQRALEGRGSPDLAVDLAALVAESPGVDFSLVLERVPGRDQLLVRAAHGWSADVVGRMVKVQPGSRIEHLLDSAGALATADVQADELFASPSFLREHGVESALSVAIPGHEGSFGLVAALCRKPHDFGPDDTSALESMAHVFAAAVERERVESALRRSQALLSGIIESATDAVITLDNERQVTLFNPAAERMFGYAEHEISGKPADVLVPERFRTRDRQVRHGFWETGDSSTHAGGSPDLFGVRKGGEEFPIEASTSEVTVNGSTFFTAIVRDITARERLKATLVQSQKMEAVGQLAGGVAHDFNNMLGIITGYGDLLLRDLEPGHPGRARLEQIGKATERAAALTRQLLAFGRKQVLQPKVLDLSAVVAEVESMLRRVVPEHVQLATRLAPDLWRIWADPRQLELAVLNLAVNARDAMPQGGQLILETYNVVLDETYLRSHPAGRTGPHVVLAVSDTGHGIDPAILPHIFEPFFTTKEPGKGTGLGLATVYGIVEQSGGFVHVYSEPGKGCTFRLHLPRVTREAVEPAVVTVAPPPSRGSETVLLVEDDTPLREMIRELLEDAGYVVLEAGEAEQALAISASHAGTIDLVLTDVVQPKMSGREVADRVRATRPTTRVLYMSGYTPETIGHHGVLEAGTTFLEKPFNSDGLLAKVREALQTPVRN